LEFIANLHRKFDARRKELLILRKNRQAEFDKGILPDFLPDIKHIREKDWIVQNRFRTGLA